MGVMGIAGASHSPGLHEAASVDGIRLDSVSWRRGRVTLRGNVHTSKTHAKVAHAEVLGMRAIGVFTAAVFLLSAASTAYAQSPVRVSLSIDSVRYCRGIDRDVGEMLFVLGGRLTNIAETPLAVCVQCVVQASVRRCVAPAPGRHIPRHPVGVFIEAWLTNAGPETIEHGSGLDDSGQKPRAGGT
jgi:hypothetical protein